MIPGTRLCRPRQPRALGPRHSLYLLFSIYLVLTIWYCTRYYICVPQISAKYIACKNKFMACFNTRTYWYLVLVPPLTGTLG